MAKQSGLGDNLYFSGYDLSGDVMSVDKISGGPALLDTTSIKQFANSRIGGVRDGSMSFTSWLEANATVATPGVPASTTPVVSTYNQPVQVTVIGGTGTNVSINGTLQGTFDGTYILPPLGTIILTYTVAPTWNWISLGVAQDALRVIGPGDDVTTYFRGTTIGNPAACCVAKQLNYDPTRDATGGITAKVDIEANGYGVEWGEMLTAGIRTDITGTAGTFFDQGNGPVLFGAQAYLQLISLVGTNVQVKVRHDPASGGAYADLIDFGSQTAIGAWRIATSNTTQIERYLKVVTTGTFTYAQFAVAFVRNDTAGVKF